MAKRFMDALFLAYAGQMRALAPLMLAGCTVLTDLGSLSSARDGSAPDGSGDAPSEGSSVVSCVGALFCADFDKVANPGDTWTTSFGLPVAFDSQNFVSAPHALGVTVPAAMTGQPRSGITKVLPNAVTTLDVDLQLRLDTPTLTGLNDMDILYIELGSDTGAGNNYLYGINPADTLAHIYQQRVVMNSQAKEQFDQIELPPLQKWFHLHIRIDNSSANNRAVTIDYDGRHITTVGGLALPVDPGITIDLGIGIVHVPTNQWHIEVDDLVLRGS
jgi:hypothetical protein